MTTRKTAFVTGASRGIGAACAASLARAGFDVAVSARTVKAADATVPGSLEETAAVIASTGQASLVVPMDLLDRGSVHAAADRVLDEWGHIDVVVNNAIYQGPGNQATLLDTSLEQLAATLEGDIVNQVALLKRVIPTMVARGSGIVIDMTSAVAFLEPPGPIGRGGWGFAYGVAKGGFDRIAGLVNAEFGDAGIVAYNIEPGFVAYGEQLGEIEARYPGLAVTPPEAIGAAVAWLATAPEARSLIGKRIHGPALCADRNLLPGWTND